MPINSTDDFPTEIQSNGSSDLWSDSDSVCVAEASDEQYILGDDEVLTELNQEDFAANNPSAYNSGEFFFDSLFNFSAGEVDPENSLENSDIVDKPEENSDIVEKIEQIQAAPENNFEMPEYFSAESATDEYLPELDEIVTPEEVDEVETGVLLFDEKINESPVDLVEEVEFTRINAGSQDFLDAIVDPSRSERHKPLPNLLLSPETEPLGKRYVVFKLDDVFFAFAAENVSEVGRPPQTTPLPFVPSWLLGITNLRGDILSVVDFQEFIGRVSLMMSQKPKMLIIQSLKEEMKVALIVDQLREIISLQSDQISPQPETLDKKIAPFLQGIAPYNGQRLWILDAEKLLFSSQMQTLEA
jgi:purine-binding chemotaxis protein CheW